MICTVLVIRNYNLTLGLCFLPTYTYIFTEKRKNNASLCGDVNFDDLHCSTFLKSFQNVPLLIPPTPPHTHFFGPVYEAQGFVFCLKFFRPTIPPKPPPPF